MTARKIGLVAALVVAMVLVYVLQMHQSQKSGSTQMQATLPHATANLSAPREITRAATPSASKSNSLSPAAVRTTQNVSALLLASDDWKNIFDQIDSMSSVSAGERLRYKAVILDACSQYKSQAAQEKAALPAQIQNSTLSELTSFITGLMKDPRQKEAMAFNLKRRITNACRGFAGWDISETDIRDAYALAAAAGDPAAQARVIRQQMLDSGARNADKLPPEYRQLAQGQRVGFPDPLDQAAQQQLWGALFSGDPIAIREVGEVLTASGDRQSFRFGANQIELGPHAPETWALVACEFGFECGPQNMMVSIACAERGQCADSYGSYLSEYGMTPDEFRVVQRNAAAIADAIRRQDYSAFQMVPGRGARVNAVGFNPPPLPIR